MLFVLLGRVCCNLVDVEFERLCDGFEFNLDTSIKVPDEGVWYVLFHRYPWHHVEATPYKRIDLAFS